jgi:hypothetical protein
VIVGTAVLIIALGIWPPALDAFFRSERLVQRPPPTLLGTRPLPAAVGGPAGAP